MANWKFDDSESLAYSQGQNFANSVVLGSTGSQEATYPKFKRIFWDEPIYNPPIQNTHMCYEFDAQLKEIDTHWKRSGKKFTDEPRLAKNNMETPGGPLKPSEFPHIMEKGSKYYGRDRIFKPFKRAEMLSRPMPQNNFHKTLKEESTSFAIGPTTYVHADPWVDIAKPVCGTIRPTSSFMTPRHPIPKTPHSYEQSRATLRHLTHTNDIKRIPEEDSVSHAAPTQTVYVNQDHHHHPMSPVSSFSSFRDQPYLYDNRESSGLGTMGTDAFFESICSQSLDTNLNLQTPSDSAANGNLTVSREPSREVGRRGRSPTSGNGKRSASDSRSDVKSYTFVKGEVPSSIEVVTGNTRADIEYRRIKLADGSPVIVSMNPYDRTLPEGANHQETWGNTDFIRNHDTALRVDSQPLSAPASSQPVSRSIGGEGEFAVHAMQRNKIRPVSPPPPCSPGPTLPARSSSSRGMSKPSSVQSTRSGHQRLEGMQRYNQHSLSQSMPAPSLATFSTIQTEAGSPRSIPTSTRNIPLLIGGIGTKPQPKVTQMFNDDLDLKPSPKFVNQMTNWKPPTFQSKSILQRKYEDKLQQQYAQPLSPGVRIKQEGSYLFSAGSKTVSSRGGSSRAGSRYSGYSLEDKSTALLENLETNSLESG